MGGFLVVVIGFVGLVFNVIILDVEFVFVSASAFDDRLTHRLADQFG
jgi:hypothetical protein